MRRALGVVAFIVAAAQVSAAAPVSIPFELVNRHIMLQARVNGSRPLSFIFDTGDQAAIVDLSVAKELGLRLQGNISAGGAGAGKIQGAYARDAKFTLTGLANFSQPVDMALPISHLSRRLGHDVDGIIGEKFIRQYVVEIDYDAHVMRLHDPKTFAYAGSGEAIPVRFSEGHPIIRASVTPIGKPAASGEFVVDLGAGSSVILHSPFVKKAGLPSPDQKTVRVIGAGGAGGAVSGLNGRVAELSFGHFTIAKPAAMFSADERGAMARSDLIGNIGYQIMRNFRVFLDYNHSRMILEQLHVPEMHPQTGFAFVAEGSGYHTLRIDGVLDDSPASDARLRIGDVIASFDGQEAEKLTVTSITDALERGGTHKMVIRRNDETFETEITPRAMY